MTVYPAGELDGLAWTTGRETADLLAWQHDLTPVSEGTVARADVLAYIAGRGENEIIVRPENVKRAR